MTHTEALAKSGLREKELMVLIALIGTCNRIPEQHLLDELVEKAKNTVAKLNK